MQYTVIHGKEDKIQARILQGNDASLPLFLLKHDKLGKYVYELDKNIKSYVSFFEGESDTEIQTLVAEFSVFELDDSKIRDCIKSVAEYVQKKTEPYIPVLFMINKLAVTLDRYNDNMNERVLPAVDKVKEISQKVNEHETYIKVMLRKFTMMGQKKSRPTLWERIFGRKGVRHATSQNDGQEQSS